MERKHGPPGWLVPAPPWASRSILQPIDKDTTRSRLFWWEALRPVGRTRASRNSSRIRESRCQVKEEELYMNWFKNLNATPKLLLSFGALDRSHLQPPAISRSSISALANDRLQVLYQDDMMGSIQAANISIARMSLGRQARDAILHVEDPAGSCCRQKRPCCRISLAIHSNLNVAGKVFLFAGG